MRFENESKRKTLEYGNCENVSRTTESSTINPILFIIAGEDYCIRCL